MAETTIPPLMPDTPLLYPVVSDRSAPSLRITTAASVALGVDYPALARDRRARSYRRATPRRAADLRGRRA